MSLPVRGAREPFESWIERVVRELERQATAPDARLAAAIRRDVLATLFPVGSLYLTDAATLPPALLAIGTWTSSATAAARGASLSANIFERLT